MAVMVMMIDEDEDDEGGGAGRLGVQTFYKFVGAP